MPKPTSPEPLTPKQFMITEDQHRFLEDEAIKNKRAGNHDLDSISKVVRAAIDDYRKKIDKKKGPGN